MDSSFLVILLTFFIAIVEKIFNKPTAQRKGFWKYLKLNNIIIVIFSCLFIAQLLESKSDDKNDAELVEKSVKTLTSVQDTQNKIDSANLLIEEIVTSLVDQVESTKEEFIILEDLSENISTVKSELNKNLAEYRKLNDKYQSQIEIEKEKLLIEKPEVDISFARIIQEKDSSSCAYQFEFINNGVRSSDSIIYSAIMVFIDSLYIVKKHGLYKTNKIEYAQLSLPGNSKSSRVINLGGVEKEILRELKYSYLVVSYQYKDWYTGDIIGPKIRFFWCDHSISKSRQMGMNVNNNIARDISQFLVDKKKFHQFPVEEFDIQ